MWSKYNMYIPKEYIYQKNAYIDGKAAAKTFRLLYILKSNKIVLQKPRTHAMFGYKFLNKQLCILIMHLKLTLLIIACVLFYSLLFLLLWYCQ